MCVKLTNVKPHSILLWKMLLYCLILMLQHTELPFQSNLCLNHCQIFSKVILSNYYQVCKSKMKIGTRSGFDFSLIGEKKTLKMQHHVQSGCHVGHLHLSYTVYDLIVLLSVLSMGSSWMCSPLLPKNSSQSPF